MFESLLISILNKHLSEYVEHLDTHQLNMGLWSGRVTLSNLQLRSRALTTQIRLMGGCISYMELAMPWSNPESGEIVIKLKDIKAKTQLFSFSDAPVVTNESVINAFLLQIANDLLGRCEIYIFNLNITLMSGEQEVMSLSIPHFSFTGPKDEKFVSCQCGGINLFGSKIMHAFTISGEIQKELNIKCIKLEVNEESVKRLADMVKQVPNTKEQSEVDMDDTCKEIKEYIGDDLPHGLISSLKFYIENIFFDFQQYKCVIKRVMILIESDRISVDMPSNELTVDGLSILRIVNHKVEYYGTENTFRISGEHIFSHKTDKIISLAKKLNEIIPKTEGSVMKIFLNIKRLKIYLFNDLLLINMNNLKLSSTEREEYFMKIELIRASLIKNNKIEYLTNRIRISGMINLSNGELNIHTPMLKFNSRLIKIVNKIDMNTNGKIILKGLNIQGLMTDCQISLDFFSYRENEKHLQTINIKGAILNGEPIIYHVEIMGLLDSFISFIMLFMQKPIELSSNKSTNFVVDINCNSISKKELGYLSIKLKNSTNIIIKNFDLNKNEIEKITFKRYDDTERTLNHLYEILSLNEILPLKEGDSNEKLLKFKKIICEYNTCLEQEWGSTEQSHTIKYYSVDNMDLYLTKEGFKIDILKGDIYNDSSYITANKIKINKVKRSIEGDIKNLEGNIDHEFYRRLIFNVNHIIILVDDLLSHLYVDTGFSPLYFKFGADVNLSLMDLNLQGKLKLEGESSDNIKMGYIIPNGLMKYTKEDIRLYSFTNQSFINFRINFESIITGAHTNILCPYGYIRIFKAAYGFNIYLDCPRIIADSPLSVLLKAKNLFITPDLSFNFQETRMEVYTEINIKELNINNLKITEISIAPNISFIVHLEIPTNVFINISNTTEFMIYNVEFSGAKLMNHENIKNMIEYVINEYNKSRLDFISNSIGTIIKVGATDCILITTFMNLPFKVEIPIFRMRIENGEVKGDFMCSVYYCCGEENIILENSKWMLSFDGCNIDMKGEDVRFIYTPYLLDNYNLFGLTNLTNENIEIGDRSVTINSLFVPLKGDGVKGIIVYNTPIILELKGGHVIARHEIAFLNLTTNDISIGNKEYTLLEPGKEASFTGINSFYIKMNGYVSQRIVIEKMVSKDISLKLGDEFVCIEYHACMIDDIEFVYIILYPRLCLINATLWTIKWAKKDCMGSIKGGERCAIYDNREIFEIDLFREDGVVSLLVDGHDQVIDDIWGICYKPIIIKIGVLELCSKYKEMTIYARCIISNKLSDTIIVGECSVNYGEDKQRKVIRKGEKIRIICDCDEYKPKKSISFKENFYLIDLYNSNGKIRNVTLEMKKGDNNSIYLEFKYSNILRNLSNFDFIINLENKEFMINSGSERPIHFGNNKFIGIKYNGKERKIPIHGIERKVWSFENNLFKLTIDLHNKQRIIQIRPEKFWPYIIVNNTPFKISFQQVDNIYYMIDPWNKKGYCIDDMTKERVLLIKVGDVFFNYKLGKKETKDGIEITGIMKGSTMMVVCRLEDDAKIEFEENIILNFGVFISNLYISVLDRDYKEVVCIAGRSINIKDKMIQSENNIIDRIQLSLTGFQIDNQNINCKFPVLLHPRNKKMYFMGEGNEEFINLIIEFVDWRKGLLEISFFCLLIQEFVFKTEEDLMHKILSCFSTNYNYNNTQSYYISTFHLNPIRIQFSYIPNKNSGNKLIRFITQNISDMRCKLNTLMLFDITSDITELIIDNYRSQIISQLFKIFGSLDFLGNLSSLVDSFGVGLHDLFYEPYQGLQYDDPLAITHGIIKGGTSLVKNTVSGVTNTLGKVSSSISKGLAVATLDKDFQEERGNNTELMEYYDDWDLLIPKEDLSDTASQKSISQGADRLIKSIYSGVKGVVKNPIKGAKKGGIGGFIAGVGKGVVGVFTKPVVGLADFASGVSDGIKYSINDTVVYRIQYPRPKGVDKYDYERSRCYYVFESYIKKLMGENGKEIFIDGTIGVMNNIKCHVIITNKRVIITNRNDVYIGDNYKVEIWGINIGEVNVIIENEEFINRNIVR
ncbi:putative vacuolar protein sorting-associated protein 13A [Astathelohania contejeani]|uniref:Vacuolar protein sorting-associated protein 13A n=1 Tax=Astathelohania contejeani TaxID=164912 RepID=A0ABQ7I1D6_9MICR|nr:putative vacuolar protein sorting-associated protein 13A [Thelohania contejeani]